MVLISRLNFFLGSGGGWPAWQGWGFRFLVRLLGVFVFGGSCAIFYMFWVGGQAVHEGGWGRGAGEKSGTASFHPPASLRPASLRLPSLRLAGLRLPSLCPASRLKASYRPTSHRPVSLCLPGSRLSRSLGHVLGFWAGPCRSCSCCPCSVL